jgi:hypothetical protein
VPLDGCHGGIQRRERNGLYFGELTLRMDNEGASWHLHKLAKMTPEPITQRPSATIG